AAGLLARCEPIESPFCACTRKVECCAAACRCSTDRGDPPQRPLRPEADREKLRRGRQTTAEVADPSLRPGDGSSFRRSEATHPAGTRVQDTITRRDFLNGFAIAIGASLAPSGWLRAADASAYPPAETGMRGGAEASCAV